MKENVAVIGAGLAGSEAALQLAMREAKVTLFERRPNEYEPVHKTGLCAELVCSNSLKSLKRESAAGILKEELLALGSALYKHALDCKVDAGGALAVDRGLFAQTVTDHIASCEAISCIHGDVVSVDDDGSVLYRSAQGKEAKSGPYRAIIVATGPLTSDALTQWLEDITGTGNLAFYDAAAPIVMADSLDMHKIFRQSRYSDSADGDYLNAPFTQEEYRRFIDALVNAKRVVAREFETNDLFQACQPIEEIARKGLDAPRFGAMKPVGLIDPRTGKRPWAVLQLRVEDAWGQSFNLVGCQTNLTFPEQQRVFCMVPGLEHAEFSRFGVMHRNTFIDAPHAIDATQRLMNTKGNVAVYVAGQVSGTEGYCEAIRSGLQAALNCVAALRGIDMPPLPLYTAYGALMAYATNPAVEEYQPKHVNFGDFEPLEPPIRNKHERSIAYADRAAAALHDYCNALSRSALLD